jgi:hypothetical protein
MTNESARGVVQIFSVKNLACSSPTALTSDARHAISTSRQLTRIETTFWTGGSSGAAGCRLLTKQRVITIS